MPTLVSHNVTHTVQAANDAIDGSETETTNSDVKQVTVVVEEALTSGKVARSTLIANMDDIADTQTVSISTALIPNTPLSEDDLDDFDTFMTYLAGLTDTLKVNYPVA